MIWIAAAALGVSPLVAMGVDVVFADENSITEEVFNQWLTNGNAATPREKFETQLSGRLSRLDRTCALTAGQRKKLELAGRGDIARFESELAPLHDELVGKTFDQNNFNEQYQKIMPFTERVRRGILDEGSLFQKVLANSLDSEQQEAFERAEAEQIEFQYRAKVKLFVATFDGVSPMADEQREALLKLLLSSTRPPKRWVRNYEWMYVLFQAAGTPRDKLGEILDKAQLRCFQMAVDQGGAFEPALKQEGMVPAGERSAPAESGRNKKAAETDEIPEIQIGGS